MEGAAFVMSKKIYVRSFFIVAIIVMVSSFYSLPYYVSKPGIAKELHPIIEVKNGTEEKGSFMLTTVRMGKANIYSYLIAKWSKFQELYPVNAIRSKDETDKEYNIRQLQLMSSSKTAAIEVAYKNAGLPFKYEYKGVYVLNVIPNMPAENKLDAADRVFEMDGKPIQSSDDFLELIKEKKAGEHVALTYERENKVKNVDLTLKAFPSDNKKVGVGIVLVDDKKILVDPEVKIQTSNIGGPSAGFMFSLEIYNQLVKEDLTKGYKIAGTGTITSDGTVGRIGGIEQKIVAADRAGADIFLAPNENGAKDSNYVAAVKTAKEIDSKMKIVPINQFDEAIQYLEDLKMKNK